MVLNESKDCFKSISNEEYVDKSMLIAYTNKSLYSLSRNLYVFQDQLVFEKLYTVNMLAAYYSKGCDSLYFF